MAKLQRDINNKMDSIKPLYSWLYDVKYEYLVAGVTGGLASTLVLHPLDLVKIRLAVNDNRMVSTPNYRGITHAFSSIYKQDGFLGLYRGVSPNVFGACTAWGIYFLIYNSIKFNMQGGDRNKALIPSDHLLIATEAGVFTMAITNPIWVIKTRMILQYSDTKELKSQANVRYHGLIDAFVKIYKTEGIRGYYKGFVPGLFGVSHGAIQFMTYEELKNRFNQYKNVTINTKLTTIEYLSFAAVSKLVAVVLTYPYQVIRARLQNQHLSYNGMVDCIVQTWNHEGWRGFCKGLGTNLLRVTPATMITFVTYENVLFFLLNRNMGNNLK